MELILYKLALKTFSIKAKHDKGLFEARLLNLAFWYDRLNFWALLGTISLNYANHKRAKATTSSAYKRAPPFDYAGSSPLSSYSLFTNTI